MKTKRTDITTAVPRREIDVLDEMDRMFGSLLHQGWLRPFHEIWPSRGGLEEPFGAGVPRVDLIDREDEILVRAEVPGVDKKDLEVELTGRHLKVKGERNTEQKTEEGEFVRCEIARGTFSRTIELPEGLDVEQTKAEFKDGILEIHLPKTHKAERRTVEVH